MALTCPICAQCGAQHAEGPPPAHDCVVCADERQFVRWDGQAWLSHDELAATHRNRIEPDMGFLGIGIEPAFAIGQRALLVPTAAGNILWDCVSLASAEAVAAVRERGGLVGIAISHPHYYSSMVTWSLAFGGIPIHLHEADRQWIMRPSPAIRLWSGDRLQLAEDATLIHCGGHFAGATVMHSARGAGTLLVGDVLQVVPDRRHVSFMRSYPNLIPLNAPKVRAIWAAVEPFLFADVHGAWWGRNIRGDGHARVAVSVDRYLRAIA